VRGLLVEAPCSWQSGDEVLAGAHEGVVWDDLLAHGKFVRSLARALVRDASLADDVEQGTWLAAAAQPPLDRERAGGWLRRVATNVAMKLRRGESRRARLEQATAAREELPPTDAAAEHLEAQRDVIDAVRGLDEKYRTVIVMRYYEELSAREIARRLAMPVASVRTRLRRAVELLRETLTARHGGDERRWLAAVAPLASSHAAVGAGAVAWAGGSIALVAVLLFVASSQGWWQGRQVATPSARPVAARTSAPPDTSTDGRTETLVGAARAGDDARPSRREDVVVDGRVVDALGEPAADVDVDWRIAGEWFEMDEEQPASRTTSTDRDGCFEFRGLDLANGFVRARKPGFVAILALQSLAFDHRHGLGLTLVLHEARSVRGSVVDENGRPVADAWVHGFSRSPIAFESRSTRTDRDGRFTLDGLPISNVYVNAFAPGFRPDHSDPIPREVEEVALRVRSEGRTRLELTVVDRAGHPARGASVLFQYRGPPRSESPWYRTPPELAHGTVPENGVLVREDLPAGGYTVLARGGERRVDQGSVELDLRAGGTTPARIEALAGGESMPIRGRLSRADGTPIASERVAVARRATDAPRFATTDAQDAFTVEAPASEKGFLYFWLMGRNFALVKPDGDGGIATEPADPDLPIDLIAEPAARLSGRVVDRDGEPVAGASIEIRGECRTKRGPVAATSSDLDGHFVFEALAPRTAPVDVVAELDSATSTSPARFTISSGDAIDDVELILPRATSIEGRVLGADGQPLAGIAIDNLRERNRTATLSDAKGRYRIIGLSAGDHELVTSNDGDGALQVPFLVYPVHLGPGERRTGFDIRLRSLASTANSISGCVRRSDGRLAIDGGLSVVLTASSGGTQFLGNRSRFEFRSLKPATYGLRALVRGDASLAPMAAHWFVLSKEVFAKPGTSDVTLVLPELAESGVLHVVFSAGEGKQVPTKIEWIVGARSDVDPEGKSSFGQEATLEDGTLDLRGFPPGDFKVRFEFETNQSIERTVTFRGSETVDLGTIDLGDATRFRGVVVDPSGAALEGVLVSPQRAIALRLGTAEADVSDTRNSETSETGRDGRFDVALMRGSLLLTKPGYAPRTWIKPSGAASSDAPLRITLLPAGHIRFVDIPADLKSRGVSIHLRWLAAPAARAGYETAEATLSIDPFREDYSLFNLPVGDYEVGVRVSNGTKTTSGSDAKPPDIDQPGTSHCWHVRTDAGTTTQIDVAKDW